MQAKSYMSEHLVTAATTRDFTLTRENTMSGFVLTYLRVPPLQDADIPQSSAFFAPPTPLDIAT